MLVGFVLVTLGKQVRHSLLHSLPVYVNINKNIHGVPVQIHYNT